MPEFSQIVSDLRHQFPSLARSAGSTGQPVVYLDGPAGSQVPQSVIQAVSDYYQCHNANTGGVFATSLETGYLIKQSHQAAADWFGCNDWRECIFGANMTTMTLAFSRALSRTWKAGDRVVVTQLDHDANVTSWRLAASDVGAHVQTVRVNPSDATLDLEDFERQVTAGTKLVAVTAASNSVGTTTPIKTLVKIAHAVGAKVYLDAVHWAPHRLIDVVDWGVDYCVCSAYKFFGPHVGLLWGRHSNLEEMAAYKLRPSPAHCPGKWTTGTQNFAAIAGVRACIDYVASIAGKLQPDLPLGSRRAALQMALAAIREYETGLVAILLDSLQRLPRVRVFGITESSRLQDRVPTVSLVVDGIPAQNVAQYLADHHVYCWHGDYYAVDICAALGQVEHGMVRLGILHTTTENEIRRVVELLERLVR